jgi:hypothetical protein
LRVRGPEPEKRPQFVGRGRNVDEVVVFLHQVTISPDAPEPTDPGRSAGDLCRADMVEA